MERPDIPRLLAQLKDRGCTIDLADVTRLCVGNDRRKLTRPRIGARCTDRAGGAGGFKFTLADCHVGYRQKALNRSGAGSVYRTVC